MTRLEWTGKKWKVVIIWVIPPLFVLFELFVLPYLLTPSLSPANAEKRIRACLKTKLSHQHLADLKKIGAALPDRETALKWQDQHKKINALEFENVKVKRIFFDILLLSESDNFVARAGISDGTKIFKTRYFWLSESGIDREIGKLAWIFSF